MSASTPALAQSEASAEPEAQAIIITGSRIARRDYTATSPIVTVDSQLLEKSGSVNLEANLNKLPQFAPALTQFVTGDIQSSATNTVGAATVSLRQLGANRNLVLIDGRRPTPINGSGVVDINTIPSAAIERVEIITGGASSTYGADAVGGVVNFILKKNFQGVVIDGQMGLTQEGDGKEYRISAMTGASLADGRGSVMLGLERYQRDEVLRINRKAYRNFWRDPNIAGTNFFFTQNHFQPDAFNAPSQAAVDGVFRGDGEPAGQIPTGNTSYYFNTNNSLFVSGNFGGGGDFLGRPYTPFIYGYEGPLDGTIRKVNAAGQLAENNDKELLSSPQTRWSFFSRANYEVADNINFFSQASFSSTRIHSVSQYAPAINGWGTLIPHGSGVYTGNSALSIASSLLANGSTNPDYLAGGKYGLNCPTVGGCTNSQVFPTPTELTALLNSRPDPNAPWQLNQFLTQLGLRETDNNNINFQMLAGFNGSVPGTDWTWEVYGSYGQTIAKTDQLNFASVQRWRAVASAPNYGQAFKAQGNPGAPGNNFQGAVATCASGVSPFTTPVWSTDCMDAVRTNPQNENRLTQTIWEGSMQGGLLDLPYGQLRFALGADYRKNTIAFKADTSATQGSSFLEGVNGIFPQGNTNGSTEVSEVYGELLVPVLADLPFAKALTLELGYRYSDYDSVGSIGTYKINGEYAPVEWLRFRGGYQKASRAPNIGELYTAATSTLDVGFDGDPCSRANPAMPAGIGNYSANPTLNPTNAAAVEGLCRQLMGAAGASQYYSNAQSTGTFSFTFPSLVGNTSLKQEDAYTYTIGGVLQSPAQSPWFNRARLTVDYYNVLLSNGISQQSADAIQRRCFSAAYNPTLTLNEFCNFITRDQGNGTSSTISVTYSNGGRVETSGIDTQLDWGVSFKDIGVGLPGAFSVNFLLNYLLHFKTTTDSGVLPLVEYAGTLGGGQVGTTPGAYRWKAFTTFNYITDVASASLQWRHLPSASAAVTATNPTDTTVGAPAYDIFNLSGTVFVTKHATIRFGVDNLFNKQPPLTNYNPGAVLPTLSGGSFDAGNYDTLGRRFYIGANFKL